ncbi:ATP-binding response regulator [Allorhizobium undicola]|uniref:hybrid sensor histidine kinase/response regulator n=1 Tax=Allorhizobium undicola TaxID=78527 RepID=UPI003D352A81
MDMQDVSLPRETAESVRERLLATVSHEMRTPLNGILGMSYLLGRTELSPEQRNYLASIVQAGEALQQLVADLLDFSTLETGHFELHNQRVSPRRLIEGVVEMLAPRAHAKGIEIAATAAAAVPPEIEVDVARLRQVLFNIIGNAVKFTQEGGVLVTSTCLGEELVIRIRDTGPGMTEEERARLFVEFSQAGDLLQRSGGTGLGLFISQRLMMALGGSLAVAESQKGKGSLFEIRLPCRPAGSDRPQIPHEELLAGSVVVVLAPEGPAAESCRASVKALGGYCFATADPMQALEEILRLSQTAAPVTDLIVDHRSISGYDAHLAAKLETLPRLRRTFLVTPEERPTRPLTGFDAWLIRPLREQTLSDVLRGLMSGFDNAIEAEEERGIGEASTTAECLNVLVGEDDLVNATLLKAVLQKAGHKVALVGDFDALRREVASDDGASADLIITDLGMPGGEGPSVLRYIRMIEQLKRRRRCPIMVLTGDLRDSSRVDALTSGANMVLQKPVNPDRLLREIRSLLQSADCRRAG